VLRDRRIWWGTVAVFAGIGAALLTGSGTAAADTGSSAEHSGTSGSQSSSNSPAAAATARHRVAPAAVVSRVRTPKPTATAAPTAATTAQAGARSAANTPAKVFANVLSVFGVAAPASPAGSATGTSARPAAAAPESAQAVVTPPATNGVTGVKVGHSTLTIPVNGGFNAPADWYFPTQADGSVQANGVIWLQHGFLADKAFYSALATKLAKDTNSIVVAPTLPSFPQLACGGCTLYGVPMQKAAATMFLGERSALTISANQAGYQGLLPEDFILAGHSAGGGWSSSVGGYYVDDLSPGDDNHLLGVVMYDGVNMNDTLPQAIASLDTLDIPVYQIAAPAQMWNTFGTTTDELLQLRPDQFDGVVLVNGSHVDAMLGSNPVIDFSAQLVTKRSPPGNTSAVDTLSTGWINDFYVGAGPDAPQYGIYGTAGQPIIMGDASAVVLPTPLASQLGPIETLMKKWTDMIMPLIFGGSPGSATVTPVAANPTVTSPTANGVTGVKTGNTTLTIQVGSRTYNAPADWYFPTQADGSVQANGIIYLQHGFLANKSFYTVLARSLASETNSIVVATTLPSFAPLTCPTCTINNPAMQQGVADLFLGGRAALTISASNAGYQGTLPEDFTLSGHSAGGGLAVAAGSDYVNSLAPGDDNRLLGVVMFDGVSNSDAFASALATLDGIPVYQIAAPAQPWNAFGQTTTKLIAERPDQFVGVELVNGSHTDSVIGSDPFFDFFAAIFVRPSAPGNATAVHTLAAGWINDFYVAAGPDAPQYGLYGPAGQPIIMGQTAAIVLPTQPAAAAVATVAA
jgi:acetyl esterase/lipase